MRFLVPLFDCCLLSKNIHLNLIANVPYLISEINEEVFLISSKTGKILFAINSKFTNSENCFKVNYENNEYVFLFYESKSIFTVNEIKFLNSPILIGCGENLSISYNGEIVFEKQIELEYSHFEVLNGLCLIYFTGQRKYVVIVDKTEIKFENFYDEFNRIGDELYFMSKCYDSLNHGKVAHIHNGKFEEYLVYLDENDLKLKSEFVANVFVDCILSGNLKYANSLLHKDLQQENENNIKNFFNDFNSSIFIEENICVLIRKNTLSGVFKFEVVNKQISNIIQIY